MAPPTKIRIHLDVDGVLADWQSAAIRLFDQDPVEVHASWPPDVWDLATVLGISTNQLWRAVDAAGSNFWANLELFPWSLDLTSGTSSRGS